MTDQEFADFKQLSTRSNRKFNLTWSDGLVVTRAAASPLTTAQQNLGPGSDRPAPVPSMSTVINSTRKAAPPVAEPRESRADSPPPAACQKSSAEHSHDH